MMKKKIIKKCHQIRFTKEVTNLGIPKEHEHYLQILQKICHIFA